MMASNKKEPQGTVLLRQAEPKYKFVGKKLPRQSDDVDKMSKGKSANPALKETITRDSSSALQFSPNYLTSAEYTKPFHENPDSSLMSQSKKPVAVVGASFQTKSTTIPANGTNSLSIVESRSTSINSKFGQPSANTESQSASSAMHTQAPTSVPLSFIQSTYGSTALLSSQSPSETTSTDMVPLDSSAAATALTSVTTVLLDQRLKEVEKERDNLKKDLDAQLQVNGELKRLLVASVGDDLSKRVERLAQDRVQLSMDIGGFSKKMTEDYETLDKISIQADMWRSKYLASRVMVEELGNARAYFSLQWHESQEALQQMLNERHELRINLLEAYKILQQVKDAFDPLNSHRSSSLQSTNVLDLSRACQQLGEAVRYRLLPAHVGTSLSVEVDLDSWENSVTRAEQYAHELLSRPSEPTGSLQSGSSCILPVKAGSASPVVNRYHPLVKHENVTIHCCKCKGEISVV